MEVRNCARDEGRSLEAGRQGQASNHRKLRRSKAVVVSVAEKAGRDPVRCGSKRHAVVLDIIFPTSEERQVAYNLNVK